MIMVLFEVSFLENKTVEYFEVVKSLQESLANAKGFISAERFQSINNPGKVLSMSVWESEEAVSAWRNTLAHRSAQQKGMSELIADYKIRVVQVLRDYSPQNREQAPQDSKDFHGA